MQDEVLETQLWTLEEVDCTAIDHDTKTKAASRRNTSTRYEVLDLGGMVLWCGGIWYEPEGHEH
jgi:hypothetical protein